MLIRLFGFFFTYIALFILYTKKALFLEPLLADKNLLEILIYSGLVLVFFEIFRVFFAWKKRKSFAFHADQFLILSLTLYFYFAFYTSYDINFPQLDFMALLWIGGLLSIVAAVSEAAFFYSLLLTSLFISLTEFQLGYHAESSSFKPVIHAALFILSWKIFIKEKLFDKNSKFIFALCLSFVVGIYYFFPGLSKIKISPNLYDWALVDDLRNLLPAMCLYGWNGACSWNQWPQWLLSVFNSGTIVVLIFEMVSIFILSGRSLVFLAGLRAAFHLIVFGIGGDIFAGLIFLNVFLVFFGWVLRKEKVSQVLNPKVAGFLLAFFVSTLIFRFPIELGWYDTRISQKYVISIVDRNEKEYKVDYAFWDHYMTNFVFADFSFLLAKTPHPVLTMGTSDTNQLDAFTFQQNLKSAQEFVDQRYNLSRMMKAEVWDNSKTLDFVKKYIFEKCVKKNYRPANNLFLRQYHHSLDEIHPGQYVSDCQNLDIVEFRIHMEESFFDGQSVTPTARIQVYEETF